MPKDAIKKMTLSAMLLAVGLVLPFFTGQIQQIGNMLLPMHIPVFLCGLICGWKYGGAVGFLTPLLRSLLFGMPVLFPNAVAMAIELAVYGLVSGLIYSLIRHGHVWPVLCAMLPAMVLGRLVWGLAQWLLLGLGGTAFTPQMFLAGALLNAIPGIVLQLLLVPALMSTLHATGLVKF